jgi:tryptophan halogenase
VWNKNCVALGLASGFIEPLESTSIHLVMMGVTRLMQLFPFAGIQQSMVDLYNQQSLTELEKIRDFIVLHFKATERTDTPFWRHCKSMEIPDSLAHRIDIFREYAQAYQLDSELFRVDSWTQVMLGQRIIPKQYHQVARLMTDAQLEKFMVGFELSIRNAVDKLPYHHDFVSQYCNSGSAN